MTRTTEPNRLAMLCLLSRFRISAAIDSGKDVGPWTRRHLGRCDGCRRFHRACQTLDHALRSEAADSAFVSSPSSRPRRTLRLIRLAIAAAACIGMAASISWMSRPEQPANSVSSLYVIATPHVELASVWTRAIEAPLVLEARNLSDDAQSSVRFLVTCLAVQPAGGFAAPQ